MRTYEYNTTIEVDIDDLLDDMSEEEIIDLFESRINRVLYGREAWINVYHARRTLSEKNFLKYIDEIIMDTTGRIL